MNDLSTLITLDQLWDYTDKLHAELFPNSKLKPIMSGGKTQDPKYMFVFINPTYRNVSSDSNWSGKRRPWTGTKYIWKIFKNAGHFDENLLSEINNKKEWDIAFADKVYDHLAAKSFYFTNIVKWTSENADLPDAQMIKTFLPILLREIQIVNPEFIVTFGLIPFNALVNVPLKLKDYYDEVMLNKQLKHFILELEGRTFKVIPSYFPVGRGDPKRAIAILKLI